MTELWDLMYLILIGFIILFLMRIDSQVKHLKNIFQRVKTENTSINNEFGVLYGYMGYTADESYEIIHNELVKARDKLKRNEGLE